MQVLKSLKNNVLKARDYIATRGARVVSTATALAVASSVAVSSAFAETTGTELTVPDLGVNGTTVVAKLTATMGTWVMGGIGIAIGVFIVKLGWGFVKQFAQRS